MSDLFEAAFEHAGVGMALISPEGRFLRANFALQELLGLAEAELLAVDFQSITHPEDLDADLALLAKLSAGEVSSYRLDKRFIRPDGSYVPTHLTVAAAYNPDGSVRCYMSQIQDNTARIEAEQGRARSEARFRLMA